MSASACSNHVDFLALVLKKELAREKSDANFEKFCLSVLLSAHIGLKTSFKRYIPETDLLNVNDTTVKLCRRRVVAALTEALQTLDVHVSW